MEVIFFDWVLWTSITDIYIYGFASIIEAISFEGVTRLAYIVWLYAWKVSELDVRLSLCVSMFVQVDTCVFIMLSPTP